MNEIVYDPFFLFTDAKEVYEKYNHQHTNLFLNSYGAF